MSDDSLTHKPEETNRLEAAAPDRTKPSAGESYADAPASGRHPGGAQPKISPEEAAAIREKALEILRRELPPEKYSQINEDEANKPAASANPPTIEQSSSPGTRMLDPIPARMLNEFVYCQRLFYYEFVEGGFVESADTLRGGAIHQRVDTGTGALPKAKRKAEVDKSKPEEGIVTPAESTDKEPQI